MERVAVLAMQGLILNKALICDYLHHAFLEGKIRNL
jgi:hypothetical protein